MFSIGGNSGTQSQGSGMFGASQPAPAFGANTNSTGGGLFGNNSNNTTNTNTNSTGGGLFGNSNSSTQSGGLFGANSNASTTASSQPSGGLFGQKPAASGATGTGGGLFGSTSGQSNAPSGGLFGQQRSSSASGGMFGSAANTSNTNNPQSTQTGGLFGNNSNNNTQSGGLFGNNSNTNTQNTNTNTNTQSGGLFGNNNTNTQSGGLFGNNNNNSTQSGGLFGNTSNSGGNSGGLFGNNSNTQASQPGGNTGGMFGNTSTQNNQSGGLFGNNSNTQSGGLFGNNSQQGQSGFGNNTQSGGLFGNTQNNAQPNAQGFGQGSGQGFGNNLLLSDRDKSVYTPSINDQLIKIKEQWDPNSGDCKLKTHFYNKLNENDLQILLNQPRPMNESPDDWNKAMSERPNNQYYPIKITSFSDVSNRIETQLDHVKKSRYLLNLINENQSKLSSKHDLENSIRIKNCKTKHLKLSRRLLKLATTLAILKVRGYPLLPEEEEISKQFELLNSKLNDPNNSLSKLNDLFARLTILKEKSDSLNYQFNNSINLMSDNLMNDNIMTDGTKPEDEENDKPDNEDQNTHEEFITKISKLLLKQQKGLNYINEILQKDLDSTNKLTN